MAIVHLNPFQEQYQNAQRQLAALQAQEQAMIQNLKIVRQQIGQTQAVVVALEPLAAQEQIQNIAGTSLADLCRAALDAYQGQWVTAQQVRSYIEQLGVRFEYNNIMAVLHNTLARVGQKGRNAFGTVYARK
jgi:hypothetical protein